MKKEKYFELMPLVDNAQSFYGKAILKDADKKIVLISYATEILELDKQTGKIKFLTKNKDHYTKTTNRHINEFLMQYTTEEPKSKAEILRLAGVVL